MRADMPGRMSLDDFRHEALAEVGSTNTECLERARKGALSGLWITAGRQTGGRGRRSTSRLSSQPCSATRNTNSSNKGATITAAIVATTNTAGPGWS